MSIHTSTANTGISLAREFQKHISDPKQAHGLFDHCKDRKCASKWKWTDHEYRLQKIKEVPYISVIMSCATTQFPELSFCGPHAKPHELRGLSKHYHLLLDPKLGNEKYTIL